MVEEQSYFVPCGVCATPVNAGKEDAWIKVGTKGIESFHASCVKVEPIAKGA